MSKDNPPPATDIPPALNELLETQIIPTIPKHAGEFEKCARINALLKYAGVVLMAHLPGGGMKVTALQPARAGYVTVTCTDKGLGDFTVELAWTAPFTLYLI